MNPNLLRSTAVVSQMTLLSRVLGLLRDIAIASAFGASAAADAFFVAFRIPNLFRRLFAEGAFSQAFVPVLAEYQAQRGRDETRALVAAASGSLGLVVTVFTVAGVLAAPVLIAVFAPGFLREADKFSMAVDLLRITFPYLAFISLTAFAGAVLNTHRRFAIPAFTPVLLNLCMIGAAIWLAPRFDEPVRAVAWGVFFGGVAQLALQLPFLRRLGMLIWPAVRFGHEGVRRILGLMGPALLGVSVAQINLLFDTLLASFLVSGSISWLYYADRLLEFPLGVFGIALATVILPTLSAHHAGGRPQDFGATLDWGLRWMVLIGVPATLGLMLLAAPLLSTAFQYRAMTAHDVRMSALALQAYSVGLLGFNAVKVLAPAFYARQDTRTPVRIAIVALVANMVFNLLLIFPLKHAGLALATSLSAFLNAGLLFAGLWRAGIYRPRPGWWSFGLRVALAAGAMSALLLSCVPEFERWSAGGPGYRATQLVLWVGAGALVYGLTLLLAGMRPRHLAAPATSL